MQPAMQMSTFPCPACGQGIPSSIPKGMKLPCPYCGTQIVSEGGWTAAQAAEYQAWAMEHGAAAASLAAQQHNAQHDPGAAHFASAAEIVATRLPSGELVALAAQVQADGTWLFKAVDLRSQRTRWEAMHGATWAFPPDRSRIAIRGARVYIGHEGILTVLDANNGAKLWSAFMPGTLARNCDLFDHPDEIMLFEVANVVVFASEGGIVMALDVARGQLVWNIDFHDSVKIEPVPGVGVLVHASAVEWVLHALPSGEVLGRWSTQTKPSFDDVTVSNGVLVAHVTELGTDEDGEGIAVLDPFRAAALRPAVQPGVKLDPTPAVVNGKVWAAVESSKPAYCVLDPSKPPESPGFFKRLFGGSKSTALVLPAPGMAIEYIHAAGTLVLFQLRPYEGGDGRRIVGIDATSGNVKFDSGPLQEEPTNMVPAQVQARADVFVHVTSPNNDDDACELRAIDTATGQLRWRQQVGHWTHHFLADDVCVVYSRGTITILDLATGSQAAAYPFV